MTTASARPLFKGSAWIALCLGILALFIAMHPALVGRLSTHFIGGTEGDGGLYVWLAESFHRDPWSALRGESYTFYPYPATRAWSDSFLLPSALISFLMHCGVPLTLSYNLVLIAAIALNGLAVAALCRSLSMDRLQCFLAAALFSCSSYFTGNFGHPQLLFFFWIPLAWTIILAARKRVPDPRNLTYYFIAGLSVSASFYCAVYYSIFAVLGLALIIALSFRPSRSGFISLIQQCSALALGMVPILWMLPTYLRVVDAFGSRGLYEADAFAASGLSYLSFSPHNLLYRSSSSWTHSEATLGIGLLALVLAAVSVFRCLQSFSRRSVATLAIATLAALCASSIVDKGITSELVTAISSWVIVIITFIAARRSSNPTGYLFSVIALFFTLSLGPAGNPAKGEPALAPFALLHAFVPGLDSMRAVSRLGSVVLMGLCIAAAVGISNLSRGARLIRCSVVILSFAAILLENYTPIFALDRIPSRPPIFDTLSQHIGPNEAAVVLPFARELEGGRVKSWSESAILSTRYALWTSDLTVPVVNGYSGQRPKLSIELPAALADFPSKGALEWLGRICGVRWIVVLPSLFKEWNSDSFNEKMTQFGDRLQIVATAEDGGLLLKLDPWVSSKGTFFVRPDSKITIELRDPLPTHCALKISELTRSSSGDLTSSTITPLSSDPERRTSTLAPLDTPLGRARVITIDTGECGTARRCIAN